MVIQTNTEVSELDTLCYASVNCLYLDAAQGPTMYNPMIHQFFRHVGSDVVVKPCHLFCSPRIWACAYEAQKLIPVPDHVTFLNQVTSQTELPGREHQETGEG